MSVGVLLLVLDRWDVAEALVQAGGVVPGDVLDDRELELCSGSPDAVTDQLVLKLSTNDSARALMLLCQIECGGGGEVGDDQAVETAGEVALEAAEDLAA